MGKIRKHSALITIVASVLIVAVFLGITELSEHVLPDHLDIAEEITLPDNRSMLIINDRESTALYPWDVIEAGSVRLDDDPYFENLYPDKRISDLIRIFSPWVNGGYDEIMWNDRARFCDTGEMMIYYLKEVEVIDGFGDTYRVSMAFTDEILLYYSCDRIWSEDQAGADDTALGYDTLNRDYSAFIDLYGNSDLSEAEYDSSVFAADNCFELFLQRMTEFDYANVEWAGIDPDLADVTFPYTEGFRSILRDKSASGVVYRHGEDSVNTVNVEISKDNVKLVLFYDLYLCQFTGFSLRTD